MSDTLAEFRKNEVMAKTQIRRLRMDDIEDLKQQIKVLKLRVETLEQGSSEKKEEGFKLWEPADEEKHYYVNSLGFWDSTKRTYVVDDNRISNFNCYKTQEIAQQEADWLRAARKLRALARELNPEGWKFSKKNPRFRIEAEAAYFHSEQAAQTALDNLTEEEKEVLFGN